MKIRPLLMDENSRAEIRRVMQFAEQRVIGLKEMHRRSHDKNIPPPGDDTNRRCVMPFGYMCVFTIEEQPVGVCRHLSVSVLGDGYAPNPTAVEMLMQEFGFRRGLDHCDCIFKEEIEPGKVAINVLEKMEARVPQS